MSAVCYILSFVKDGQVKKYIGHTANFRKRLIHHLRTLSLNRHHNSILQMLYNDGWRYDDSPEIILMPNKKLAQELEKSLILANWGSPDVVNIECGGDTFTKNPRREEIKVIITEHLKSFISGLSPEERSAVYSKPGELNGMFGRTHKESSRALIKEKLRAYYETHDYPAKGLKRSKEQREFLSRMASLRVGELNPFFGKVHSDETKRKLAEANKGKLPPNTKRVSINGIEYESMTEAGRRLGLNASVVLWRIKSKNPKFFDWKWFQTPND